MSSTARLPVTWQDYADLWAYDPAYQREYAIIKPTLDALGITPGGSGDGNPHTYPVNTPKSLYHVDIIGGNDPPTGIPGTNSDPGPGLPPQAEPYKSMIEEASRRTGVPASLLAGVIHDESRWQPGASSTNANGGGDTGLMQINDGTFAALQAKHTELQGCLLPGRHEVADEGEIRRRQLGDCTARLQLR